MNKKKLLISSIFFILIISLLTTGCVKESDSKEESTITIEDMANRKVKVPTNISKVYATNPSGTIFVYTLDPDSLIGLNYEFTDYEKQFVDEKYRKLPVLGGWFGKNSTGNVEEILKYSPDLIVNVGKIDETSISASEKIEEILQAPVIMLGDNIEEISEAYEILGKVLGKEKRAQELAKYSNDILKEAEENSSKIKEEDMKKVYYAEGPKGLETEGNGSRRMKVLELVKGENASKSVETKDKHGKTNVSLEELLMWNPEYILVGSDPDKGLNVKENILKDPLWQDIEAVKNKNIYEIPHGPFNWFDRPPAVNRLMGIKWLGNLIYPEVFDYDIKEETTKFYKQFYNMDLNEEQIEMLLSN
ncbi:ABC transporter substrate-binding protein [Anaerosalibacter massiliensis]|uniref:ABC transporter substrate-binding protein n=1 Tax=Anaerosalibacter massiliensis TaxID=1347392 RepID=A0A9X2S470_9FIRM|nr:ABC transporter substrate-binding protein [Anaerosalibacter massiliensis]MCR2042974.1 ABC transporter substrate-binding protein [Anaerosalibacter massiliensis]